MARRHSSRCAEGRRRRRRPASRDRGQTAEASRHARCGSDFGCAVQWCSGPAAAAQRWLLKQQRHGRCARLQTADSQRPFAVSVRSGSGCAAGGCVNVRKRCACACLWSGRDENLQHLRQGARDKSLLRAVLDCQTDERSTLSAVASTPHGERTVAVNGDQRCLLCPNAPPYHINNEEGQHVAIPIVPSMHVAKTVTSAHAAACLCLAFSLQQTQ